MNEEKYFMTEWSNWEDKMLLSKAKLSYLQERLYYYKRKVDHYSQCPARERDDIIDLIEFLMQQFYIIKKKFKKEYKKFKHSQKMYRKEYNITCWDKTWSIKKRRQDKERKTFKASKNLSIIQNSHVKL